MSPRRLGSPRGRYILRTITCLAAPFGAAIGQPAQPTPDVFVARLTIRDGTIAVAGVRNITSREGYDNQPSWSGDGRFIFFTARDTSQTDIFRIEVATGISTPVTTTVLESEYSATPVPGASAAVSVIRVERDSTQRLWRVPLNGGPSSVILERIKPVGYHAWADSVTLALFVLGSPTTLQLADIRTGKVDTVASNIGRSLHRHPRERRISFVHKVGAEEWWIELIDPSTRATERIVRLPKGVEDYAWTPQGDIIVGEGSTLKRYDPKRGGSWEVIADLASAGLSAITRLAVSPPGDAIAIVAVPVR